MLVVAVLVPATAGGSSTEDCDIQTASSYNVLDTIYVAGATVSLSSTGADIWLEDNGVEGLQKGTTVCESGRTIPADICLATRAAALEHCPVTTSVEQAESTSNGDLPTTHDDGLLDV